MQLLDELWRRSRLDYFSDLKGEKYLPRVMTIIVGMQGYRIEEWAEAVRYLFGLQEQPDFRSEDEARDFCRRQMNRIEKISAARDGPQMAEVRTQWRKKQGILRPPDDG